MKIILYILLIITLVFLAGILYYGITKPDDPKPITEQPVSNPFTDTKNNIDKILVKKVPIVYPDFSKEKEFVNIYRQIGKSLLANVNRNYFQSILDKRIRDLEKSRDQVSIMRQQEQERKNREWEERLFRQRQPQQIYATPTKEDIKEMDRIAREKRLQQYEKNMRDYEERISQMKRDKAQQNKESYEDEVRRFIGGPIPR